MHMQARDHITSVSSVQPVQFFGMNMYPVYIFFKYYINNAIY